MIWSACAWVSFPAVTAAAISVFSCATSAATSPAEDLPAVASATCASVFPDWRSDCSAAVVIPRYVAAAAKSSPGPTPPM